MGSMETGEQMAIKPLTAEQRAQALAAVEQARELQTSLLARWGGTLFSPSWELLEEARALRDRQSDSSPNIESPP